MDQDNTENVENTNELMELQNKLQEYENDLKRIHAEFQNFQKRTEKEKNELLKYASHKLIIKLIKIKEDFERALQHNASKEELLHGLDLIKKELDKLFDEEEVEYIEVLNKKYDPFIHEVIEKIISDEEENKIIEEVQKGYYYKDKILRNPKVKISGGNKNE